MTGESDRGDHGSPHDPIEGVVGMMLGAATVGTSSLTAVNRLLGLAVTAVVALVSIWLVVRAPAWLRRAVSVLRRVRFRWVILTSFCLVMAASIPIIVTTPLFRAEVFSLGIFQVPLGTAVQVGNVTAGDWGDLQGSVPAAVGDVVSADVVLSGPGLALPAGATYIAWDAGSAEDSAIVVRIWLESSSGRHLTNWTDAVINVTQGAPHGRVRLESVDAAGMSVRFFNASREFTDTPVRASVPPSGRQSLPAEPARNVDGEVVTFRWRVTVA